MASELFQHRAPGSHYQQIRARAFLAWVSRAGFRDEGRQGHSVRAGYAGGCKDLLGLRQSGFILLLFSR